MLFRAIDRGAGGLVALLGAALLVSGCQGGGVGSALGLGSPRSPTEDRAQITQDELQAFCPSIALRSEQAFFNTYARGGEDDPTKIVHQATITDVTRACTFGAGTITINVGVAGRVVPGPAAAGGTVDMPVRILVVQGTEQIYSQVVNHQVQIAPGAAATQFLFTKPDITIPTPTARNIRVFVGYEPRAAARRG